MPVVAPPPRIGVNQAWQNVTSSRASGTTYTNTTDKPLMCSIRWDNNSGCTVTVSGANALSVQAVNLTLTHSFIVPPGATYRVTAASGIGYWAELR